MGFQEKIYNQLRTMNGTQNRILSEVESVHKEMPKEESVFRSWLNLIVAGISISGIISIIIDIIQFLGGVK
jgi:hypothetical protein